MKSPDYFKKSVIYQIVLRNFTRKGTLQAATGMLPHVRDCGADIAYLTPFMTMDTDMDVSGWSPRQIKAGFNTPKNPYRIADYNHVDPEYGDEKDLKTFVERAHALGLRVIFDLVYYHCGPSCVVRDAVADPFQHNPDGSIRTGQWNFPIFNFDNPELCEYLYANMLFFARDIECDGFRCDVGDQVPATFWAEGLRRIREFNPDFVMINEGMDPGHLEKAFHACYNFSWSNAVNFGLRQNEEFPFSKWLKDEQEFISKVPEDACILRCIENHDIANDYLENRFDRSLPVEAGNAAFVMLFLQRGIPLLFNGNEIADNARSCFFGPVEDPRRAEQTVDWGRALQPEGQQRLALIRKLSALRHEEPAFYDGSMEWLENSAPDQVATFIRTAPDGSRVFVAVNLSGLTLDFTMTKKVLPAHETLLSHELLLGTNGVWHTAPRGYIVTRLG